MKTIWQTPDGLPPSKLPLPLAPAPSVVPKLKAPVRRGPYRNSAKILAEMLAFLRGGSKLRKELEVKLQVDNATMRRTLDLAVAYQLVTTTVDMTSPKRGTKPTRVELAASTVVGAPVAWYDGKTFYGSQEAASMCCADMETLKPVGYIVSEVSDA